jgi:hypothetical protein
MDGTDGDWFTSAPYEADMNRVFGLHPDDASASLAISEQ